MGFAWDKKWPDKKRESNAAYARRKRGLKQGMIRCSICGRTVGLQKGGVYPNSHKDQFGRWCGS